MGFTISLLALLTEAAPSVFRGTWLLRATDTWRIGGRPPTATLTGSLLSLCRQSASSKKQNAVHSSASARSLARPHPLLKLRKEFPSADKISVVSVSHNYFFISMCVTSLYYSASYSSLSVL